MTSSIKFPYYAKIALILIGFYVLISMLSIVQDIILPIIYAILLAILVSPLVNLLTNKGLNRTVSICLVLFFSFTILVALILLGRVSG